MYVAQLLRYQDTVPNERENLFPWIILSAGGMKRERLSCLGGVLEGILSLIPATDRYYARLGKLHSDRSTPA